MLLSVMFFVRFSLYLAKFNLVKTIVLEARNLKVV